MLNPRSEDSIDAALQFLLDQRSPGLIIITFKERPEEFMRLYHTVGVMAGEQRFADYVDANPRIAFDILFNAFPDVFNRLWFRFHFFDVSVNWLIRDALYQPFMECSRAFFDPPLLRQCAQDEKLARRTARLFLGVTSELLPHAQYCFESHFRCFVALNFIWAEMDDLFYQGVLDHFLMLAPSYSRLYIEPRVAANIELQLSLDDDEQANELRFQDCAAPLLHVERHVVAGIVSKKVALFPFTVEDLQLVPSTDLNTQWEELSLENLRIYMAEHEPTENYRAAHAKITRMIDDDIEETALEDRILHRSYAPEAIDEFYREAFGDELTQWIHVLRLKVQLQRMIAGVSQPPLPVFDSEGRGHLIFQCHACGKSTSNIDDVSGVAFCNEECREK